MILELARSEQTYTFQRPIDYATAVLAGAIAAGWQGPVFLQGDHYQFNAKKYAADPEAMTEEIRRACRLAIDAGYRNIDIDASTLVDLSKADEDEQQRENYERTAELVALIRSLEPDGVTVSVGGEIGEVGKENSTEARAPGVPRRLPARARRAGARRRRHLARSASRPARRHGGVPLPGRRRRPRSSSTSRSTASSATSPREYGLAGAVQHGASTLPDELFHRFPEVETAEIHLATGFQNALYEHPAFPKALHEQIEAWCFANALDERKADQTDQQFVYTTRKKAHRAVQAPAVGPRRRRTRSWPPRRARSPSCSTSSGWAARAGDGRPLRRAGRVAPAAARAPSQDVAAR